MKQKTKIVPWVLAIIYLAWSLLAYFGTLGSEGHSWWPICLYALIWPWSWLEHAALEPLFEVLFAPGTGSKPDSFYIAYDRFAGAYYILVGTIWYWFLGRAVSWIIGKFSVRAKKEPIQPPQTTTGSSAPDRV